MTNVRETLVDAATTANAALQSLRDREKLAVKQNKPRVYARLARTYDAAKETADAAALKLIDNLVELPPRKADEFASATDEMKRQVEKMDNERQALEDLAAAFQALTAIIGLIGLL